MENTGEKQRYYWQPLPLNHLITDFKFVSPKVLIPIIGWAFLIFASLVISSKLMPTSWLLTGGDKIQLTRFFIFYPSFIIGLLLMFWGGFEWGFIPLFISSFALAFFSGMNVSLSIIFGFSFIFGLAFFGLAYQSLRMPYDLKDFKSIAFFISVSFVAALASSMGAFIWSLSHSLSASDTAIIWQSWWAGIFFQSILITGPLLFLGTPYVEKAKHTYYSIDTTNKVSLKWVYGTIISITAVLLLFIFSSNSLGRYRIDEVLSRLPNIARGDVIGALGSFEIIFWLSMGLIVLSCCTAFYLVGSWNRELKARVDERTVELEEKKRRLRKALNEKKLLLKEVHHRVKNNLAQVNALLQLQMMTVDDEKYTQLIQDSCTRIKSMSLIHQALYETEEFDAISLEVYIKKLTTIIHQSFRLSNANIDIEFQLIEYSIATKQAIPVGLIMTEILINAHKYAFKGKKEGVISIALQQNDTNLLLTLKDDGVGIPEKSLAQNDTLGMELIRNFSRQIDAELTINSTSSGTSFSLLFEPKS